MQRRTNSWYRPGAMKRLAVSLSAVMLAGTLAVPVMAQDDEPDMDSYISDAYDFSVEWDRDVWNSSSSASFNDQESFWISNGVTNVSFTIAPAGGQTVDECVEVAVSDIESTPEYIEPEIVNDIEIPGARDDEGVTMVYGELLDGRESPVEVGLYLTCTPVGPDGMLLIQVDSRLGIWGEEIEIVEALLDTLDPGI